MQVPENEVVWTYSLLQASENKANARTGTPQGAAAELVGIDGSNNGGLKPFAGFRKVRNFSPENAPDSGSSSSVLNYAYRFTITNPYTNHAHQCRVVDFWSFSIVTSNQRVYGYVYVVRRPNVSGCVNTYDLMMDYYAPQGSGSSWSTLVLQQGMSDGGILSDGGKAVMSVETTSKAVYVFRRGVSPIAVYFKYTTGPVKTAAALVSPAGPGVKPTLKQGSLNYGSSTTNPVTYFSDPMVSTNPVGSVVLNLEGSGGLNGTTPANNSTATELIAGTYGFAVQFEDTNSGRKSQISDTLEFTFTGAAHKAFIEGVYDSTRFDTLNIYRSVRTANAAGAFTAGILQLEAQILIYSYAVTSSGIPVSGGTIPTSTGTAYFRYSFQLTDSALVMQDVFLDKPSYSTTMPKGGAGALLDGTMLVGNISENAGDLSGTGETRWSASGADSPELFTASGTYKPANVGDAVTCFKRTGQIMSGFTRSGVQFFSKQDGVVRVLAAHQGYGVVGPYAATTVGPVTYYLNYRGLKSVYPDGRLDDVTAINQLVSDEWVSGVSTVQDLSKVSMAFDAATLTMYILNPVRQHSVVFWFATGVVSELQDMSFGKVTQGWWEDTDGQLVPRAMFLYNAPYPDAVTATGFRPCIYMPSRSYDDKTYPENNVTTPCSMLDGYVIRNPTTAPSVGEEPNTVTVYDSTCTPQLLDLYPVANVFSSGSNYTSLIGMWVYAVTPVSNGYARFRIVDADANYIYFNTVETYGTPTQIGGVLPVGVDATKLVVDPVYVRWIGGPMRMTGEAMEEMAVRQPTSLGVVISDLDYTAGSGLQPQALYWVGGLYRNNDMTPLICQAPTLPDGSLATNSLSLGDSANWAAYGKHSYIGQWFFPGFQTFLPNVQYRLVGAQVKGRMLPTDRTRRTY